jgi:hypothetical protein
MIFFLFIISNIIISNNTNLGIKLGSRILNISFFIKINDKINIIRSADNKKFLPEFIKVDLISENLKFRDALKHVPDNIIVIPKIVIIKEYTLLIG